MGRSGERRGRAGPVTVISILAARTADSSALRVSCLAFSFHAAAFLASRAADLSVVPSRSDPKVTRTEL
eukprot:COSAG01_NODE_1724_length_9382_cov_6.435743_8_plen_69_part_00